ncbi:uncharacterized protein LOC100904570 isoform X2 [Galendromus occidentalis]|uniref:Uncharacterized protein LOC100904570 isoform X2 n=1 Tax=Galendromus occidentalis TaxID=34638 RepID=A0AAJ6QV42_9ACAR|nr:uncharacterized protein LOC100904570 isoform X2 [Galendromus occidentalis]
MSSGTKVPSDNWFRDLVDEALQERGFRTVEGESQYTHKSCPGAKFEFVWTKLSDDLVTGNSIWSVGDVSECITLHKLQKLEVPQRNVIKIQIVNNLLLPCLYACETFIHGSPQQGLLALPAEVSLQIMENLPAASLCSLAVAHPTMKLLTAESKLWERLFRKDFPLAKPSVTLNSNWKELYKTEYLAGRAIYRRSAVLPTVRRHHMSEADPRSRVFKPLDFYRKLVRYNYSD